MDVLAVVVVVDRAGEPGVLTPLGGVPVVVHSVRALLAAADVRVLTSARLVVPVVDACAGLPVTVHSSASELWTADREAHSGQRSACTDGDGPITARRCLLVHDAARPLVPAELISTVVDAVRAGHPVVVPVLPLADTVKRVDPDGLVQATPDRAGLRVVQTPQGFSACLPAVLAAAQHDPVHAWNAAGGTVHTVPGHPLAFPVHTAWDLQLAESGVVS